MKKYLLRVSKYALYLVVLFLLIFLLLRATGYSHLRLVDVFWGERGWMMPCVIVGFALLYPFFGFVKRGLFFDATQKVEQVEQIMTLCGYKRSDTGDTKVMRFDPVTPIKKLMQLYEGEIYISTSATGTSIIEGPRGEVTKALFRMKTYIK